MDDHRLDRIENKLDKMFDKINRLEVDVAKQEQKIFKRMLSMLVLLISLAYTSAKLIMGSTR